MFDPSQLLNAMMSGGLRGSPLSDLLGGGGRPAGGGGGHPLGTILGGLLGGGGGAEPGYGAGLGGGGVLGSVLGGLLGGGRGGGAGLGGMAGSALISVLASALLNRGGGAQAAVPAQDMMATPVEADPEHAQRNALLLIRAMIAAAKADGQIDAEEQRRIVGKLKEAGADAEACAFVEREIAQPSSLDALVAAVPDAMTAAQVYMASLFAINVDTPAEKAYLAALAKRLGLPEMSA